MKTYIAVCETQSCGHYERVVDCGHAHRTTAAAQECAGRWQRREERIARADRKAGLSTSNNARYVAREA